MLDMPNPDRVTITHIPTWSGSAKKHSPPRCVRGPYSDARNGWVSSQREPFGHCSYDGCGRTLNLDRSASENSTKQLNSCIWRYRIQLTLQVPVQLECAGECAGPLRTHGFTAADDSTVEFNLLDG